MAVQDVQPLAVDMGTVVVPALTDYDDASPDWTETEFRADAPEGHVIGAWRGEPGWVRIGSWPYTEVCVIKVGRVEITDQRTGAVCAYGPGEAFVVPEGFSGIWRTVEPCEKVFVGIGG